MRTHWWANRWPTFLIYTIVLLLLLVAGHVSHISDSEFWPISLSREVWHLTTWERSLFYKPIFHALLATIYLFPLDNWDHVIAARLMFSVIGFASFILFVKWLTKEFSIERNTRNILLIALIFLTPSFVFQLVKVRSDLLSLFFTLVVLNLASIEYPWRSGRLAAVFFSHIALLVSTPRALFHSLILVVFIVGSQFIKAKGQGARLNRQIFLAIVAPFLSMVVVGVFAGIVVPPLSQYLRASYLVDSWRWELVWRWVLAEPLTVILGFLGVYLVRDIRARILFVTTAVVFCLADLKSPFLLASMFPFFILPFIIFMTKSSISTDQRRTKRFYSICGVLLFFQLFLGSASKWLPSNLPQKEVLIKISEVLHMHPEYLFFDGLGALPRANQILSYLGPNDSVAVDGAWFKITRRKPDLVFATSRTFALGNEFVNYISENYQAIGPNIYLSKRHVPPEKQIELSSTPYLVFGL